MASVFTNEGLSRLNADVVWDSAGKTIKACLLASSATPNKDDTTLSGMTGFSRIGTDQSLSSGNRVRTKDTTNDLVLLRYTATLTWSAVAAGSTVGTIIIYVEDSGADSGRVPLMYIDVTDVPTNGSDLTYTGPTQNGNTNTLGYFKDSTT
jgi:hypothetical protein